MNKGNRSNLSFNSVGDNNASVLLIASGLFQSSPLFPQVIKKVENPTFNIML